MFGYILFKEHDEQRHGEMGCSKLAQSRGRVIFFGTQDLLGRIHLRHSFFFGSVVDREFSLAELRDYWDWVERLSPWTNNT